MDALGPTRLSLFVGQHMRTTIRWSVLVFAALVIAAIPTRLGSHDVAVGFPFTWHARQEIISLGQQPQSFSALLLLCDFGIALLVLAVIVKFVRMRQT
jgi:hypothetical protein